MKSSPFQRFWPGLVLRIVTTCGVSLIAAACSDRKAPDVSAAQSPPVVQQGMHSVDSPPAALLQVGETAAVLFDAARLSNWTDAAAAIRDLKESAAQVPDTFSKRDLSARLQNRIEELGDSVSTRERVQTMDFANGITRLAAELSQEYQTELPYPLVMLGYYGRELELGIVAGNQTKLKQAVADLRQTWSRFEQTVLDRGAGDEARRFTDIVAQLDGAQAPGDFVEPARAELDAVDRLEKILRRQKP